MTRYAGRTVRVMHDGPHFKLDLKYDPSTRETSRTWVYVKEKVVEVDCHLTVPKAKSSGEKVSLPDLRNTCHAPSTSSAPTPVPDRPFCTQA